MVAMVYCTGVAYANGDPTRIFRGIADPTITPVTICGQDSAADYPYLYFYNPF
jgi:hypothetical protein